jgi:hypothetical protein
MEEGGFSPMLSEQLRIDAGQKFSEALQAMHPFKTPYHGLRLAIQKLQAPIFEHWIPHLKTAAYLNDAAALLERKPELNNDPIARGVALRAVAKSIDNRFGEMFYGGLFWDRYVKDAGIGSFLSLGWNLGFAREFLGAGIEAATRPAGKLIPGMAPSATRAQIRDATNKIKFASIYLGTAALIGGVMTKMLSGEDPKELNDYIFPRVGGVNPDGSPRRLTTMFYTREVPMLQKHIEEHGGGIGGTLAGGWDMVLNKLMFQPLKELWDNRSYFGSEIWDTNAPAYKQVQQALTHIISQQSPMAFTGAHRAEEKMGIEPKIYPTTKEGALSYLGFGPAPAYAEHSATQSRIAHLFSQHVAPADRPYQDPDVTYAQQTARTKLAIARQSGTDEEKRTALQEAKKAGLSERSMATAGKIGSDQNMFQRLPQSDQLHILERATPEERQRYWMHASSKTRIQFNKEHPREGR